MLVTYDCINHRNLPHASIVLDALLGRWIDFVFECLKSFLSHILWKYHLIRNFVDRGDVKVCKVHTDSNVADPLTKPLPQPKHEAHMRSMGIRYLHQ